MQATPLQMANVAAIVVNGGTLYRPHVVEEIRDPQGRWSRASITTSIRQVRRHRGIAARGPRRHGQGDRPGRHRLRPGDPGLPYGGKTGTVETDGGNGPNTTWFVAYAPPPCRGSRWRSSWSAPAATAPRSPRRWPAHHRRLPPQAAEAAPTAAGVRPGASRRATHVGECKRCSASPRRSRRRRGSAARRRSTCWRARANSKRTGRDIVHLEVGEPDFDTPEHIKTRGDRRARSQPDALHAVGRLPGLRDTIADYASRFRGIAPFARDEVVVGPGAKPIIWNMLSALLDPGDEFVYADPAYPAYASAAGYLRREPCRCRCSRARISALDLDELAAKRHARRPKSLVINSPHNPTGGVLTRARSGAIAELAIRNDVIGHLRRDLQPQPLRRRVRLDRDADGDARTHDHPRRFLESLRHDGLAAGLRDHARHIARTVTLCNNNTFSCMATFVQTAGIAALERPRRTGPGDGRRIPPAARRPRRGPERDSGHHLHDARGRVLRFPQLLADHDRRQKAGLVLPRRRRGRRAGRIVLRRGGQRLLRFSYAASLEEINFALERIRRSTPPLQRLGSVKPGPRPLLPHALCENRHARRLYHHDLRAPHASARRRSPGRPRPNVRIAARGSSRTRRWFA